MTCCPKNDFFLVADNKMKNIFQLYAKQISLKFLIVTIIFICALVLFVLLAHEAVLENEDEFDRTVHNFVVRHSFPGLIKFMESATFFGSSYFLLPAYSVVISYLCFRKRIRDAVDISVIAVSSFAVVFFLKLLFHRSRPDLPIIKGLVTYSFPSGHSLSSFIFCSILGYLISKSRITQIHKLLLLAVLCILTLTVGISRIVLNVHYATDVIAGFCFGVIWVIFSFWLINHLFPYSPQILSGESPADQSS